MKKLGYHPKKRLGQHFLIDDNVCRKIIDICRLQHSDTVVEVGAGLGALTTKLAPFVKKLIAIEIDPDLCKILQERLSQYRNTQVLCRDFLKYDLSSLKRKVKVIGNLPFYITAPIIERILIQDHAVQDCFISVQKEVAQRIIASAGSKQYGSFSLFVQFYAQPQILFSIKKTCFWPQPEVNTSFLRLRIRRQITLSLNDERLFFKIIRTAFNQRRKRIINSLKPFIAKDTLCSAFNRLNINSNARAENLTAEDFLQILNLVKTIKQS
jgi:16S rRNA (adenine1518-N6/adenine1519-N6)-dimethyltransferase